MDIEETDLRAIVRLLGETAALPGGLMGKKVYLLDGLCDIAGSMEWVWTLTSTNTSASSFSLKRKIGETFHWPLELPEEPGPVGDPPPEPPPSHTISSTANLSPHTQSTILLLRNPGEPAYSRRECNLALLVLDEIPWLHWREWKNLQPLRPKLSPRLQWTMDLLQLGLGRKEIAGQIGISEGTISGYMRELYQQFGVNSQAELMRIRPCQSTPN